MANFTLNEQLEAPKHLCFRDFPLAQNALIDPMFGKPDMGPLVHSRGGSETAAVSVPFFESDLVAEV